ncbi:MAG: hypothetical protein V1827_01165 [Candidatus Micrarchaeota archaeon]
MASRFGRYGPETEKVVRSFSPKTEALEAIVRIWKRCRYQSPSDLDNTENLKRFIKAIRSSRQSYTSCDVTAFCMLLSQFQYEENFCYKAGIFLSALVNCGPQGEYPLHLGHLDSPVLHLGFRNPDGKTIIVNDRTNFAGEQMEGGMIIIKGDVGSVGDLMSGGFIEVEGRVAMCAGFGMTGGNINISGDCTGITGSSMKGGSIETGGDASRVGGCMRGGSITVFGKAHKDVGEDMMGGEIHLEGDYDKISEFVCSGKIFHKGVLIRGRDSG